MNNLEKMALKFADDVEAVTNEFTKGENDDAELFLDIIKNFAYDCFCLNNKLHNYRKIIEVYLNKEIESDFELATDFFIFADEKEIKTFLKDIGKIE